MPHGGPMGGPPRGGMGGGPRGPMGGGHRPPPPMHGMGRGHRPPPPPPPMGRYGRYRRPGCGCGGCLTVATFMMAGIAALVAVIVTML